MGVVASAGPCDGSVGDCGVPHVRSSADKSNRYPSSSPACLSASHQTPVRTSLCAGEGTVFPGEALAVLHDIAERENKPLDEVVERAPSMKLWSLEVTEAGDEVVVRHGRKDKYLLSP